LEIKNNTNFKTILIIWSKEKDNINSSNVVIPLILPHKLLEEVWVFIKELFQFLASKRKL